MVDWFVPGVQIRQQVVLVGSEAPVPQLTRHGSAPGLAAADPSPLLGRWTYSQQRHLAGGEAGPQSPRAELPTIGPDACSASSDSAVPQRPGINCPNNPEEKTQLGQKSGDTELGGKSWRSSPCLDQETRSMPPEQDPCHGHFIPAGAKIQWNACVPPKE